MPHQNSRRFGALAAALVLPICAAAATDTTPVPISGEIPVNTLVRASQLEVIARDAYGNFVIAWTGIDINTNNSGIWARLYSATGIPLSGEFRVDSGGDSYESQPAIAMAPTGEFVIVWTEGLVWTEGNGLRARRYDAHGLALGPDFALNGDSPASYVQNVPRAAMQPDGGFVVAWEEAQTPSSYFDIFVRRYDANGQPLGAAARANTYTSGHQDIPALAVGADGRYIVAWDSDSQEGPQGSADAPGVYAQRFNPDGSRAGEEFRVPQSTAGVQQIPSVAYRPDGGFTVVWSGDGFAAPQGSTFLRRFDASGQALGGELVIAQDQTLWHGYGTVATDRLGREVVTWTSRPSQERYDLGSIWLRRFDTDGAPMGDQIEASITDGNVDVPRAAALDSDGDFVVLWARSNATSPDPNLNLYFRRFRSAEPVDVGLNISSDVSVVLPGATVNLQLAVQNKHATSSIPGIGSSTGISLALSLPSGAQLLSLDGGTDWTCSTALLLSCTLNAVVDAGAVAPLLHLVLRAPEATGMATLSGTVNADQSDPLASNNIGTLQLQIGSSAPPADTTPDAFDFVDQTDVPLAAPVLSNVITVSGINQPTTITISGADASYSVNGGAFVNTAGTVKAGDRVQLRINASPLPFTAKHATVSIGGITDEWLVRSISAPPADTTPDAFDFADQADVPLAAPVLSNVITVSGINQPTTITISGADASYSVNGGAFVNTAGTVKAGDRVQLRINASPLPFTAKHATVSIGGITDEWLVRSISAPPADTTPDAFDFVDQTDVPLAAPVLSNVITVSGINQPTTITISGADASYSVNGGAFVNTAGTVKAGDRVQLRINASPLPFTAKHATVSIGGITDEWLVRSISAPTADTTPDAFVFVDQAGVPLAAQALSNVITVSGINQPTAITISGLDASYSINGGAFVSTAGIVKAGDRVQLRIKASILPFTAKRAAVSMGGVADEWLVRTGLRLW